MSVTMANSSKAHCRNPTEPDESGVGGMGAQPDNSTGEGLEIGEFLDLAPFAEQSDLKSKLHVIGKVMGVQGKKPITRTLL